MSVGRQDIFHVIAHEGGIHKEILDIMVPGIGIMMDHITEVIIINMMIWKDMAEKPPRLGNSPNRSSNNPGRRNCSPGRNNYTGKSDNPSWRSRSNEQARNCPPSSPGQSSSHSFRDVKSTPPHGYSNKSKMTPLN